MAVIAIFCGLYCQVEDILSRVAETLNYEDISEKLLEETSKQYNIPIDKLLRSIYGPASFLEKLSHEKERHVAYLKYVLASLAHKDNVIYHGFGTLLLPANVGHILKVYVIADHNYRVSEAARQNKISEKEADNLIRKDDNKKFQWSQYIIGTNPWEEEHYDIIIPMQDMSIEKASDIIIENSRKDVLKTTARSRAAMEDFVLAAKINVALAEKNRGVEVESDDGRITIIINKYVKRVEQKKNELKKIVEGIPGVKNVQVKVGPKFNIPSIYPPKEFEVPRKVLLVDDEKEFVHTLSDRLKSRHVESAVVYDGEEALSFVEGDEPEVMVLDLKMPGIDGIEVLRRVKQVHPNTEVIILTGHGSEKEEKLAEELGAFAYLQKPVDIDKLSDTMRKAYKKIRDRESESDN